MNDILSTLFSEVQRESYQGVIGQAAHDRRTYDVLLGDGSEPSAPRRRPARAAMALRALTLIGGLGALLYWLVQLYV